MPVIVIVDDRVTNRDILAKLAASLDEETVVQSFADPGAALEWIGDNTPDLVITDYKMPAMDGAAFIRELRSRPLCADVPIIVVTVYEDRDFRYKALEAGATDFLLSPLDHYEFRTRAHNLLTLRRQQQIIKRRASVLEQKLRTTNQLRKEELRESEEKLRLVTNSVPAMICVTDRSGCCVFVNNYQGAFFSTDPEAAVGLPIADLFGDAYAVRHLEMDQRIFTSGETIPASEESHSSPEGDKRFFLTTKAPLFDSSGRVANVVTVSVDVTERQAVENALKTAKEEAEAGNRTKSEFLARMSHELRTPLNAVIGFADVMKAEMLGPVGNEKYLEYAEDIRASAEHLLGIISDMLDVSSIESGRLELVEVVVEPQALVEKVTAMVRGQAVDGGVRIEADCAPDLPALRADETRLHQILLNVLSNAIKFTPEGGLVRLAVTTTDDDEIRFRVTDTGIGMADDELAVALAKFGRLESSVQSRYSGTGLGLPLACDLAELHGGRLDIESQEAEGTTVTVVFPAERTVHRASQAGQAGG